MGGEKIVEGCLSVNKGGTLLTGASLRRILPACRASRGCDDCEREGPMAEREEALALLDASYNGILTTLSAGGRPIGTPVWSALVDGFLYIRTMTSSAKVRRLRADPRCSFVVEAGETLDELHYAHVSADAEFVEDDGERWKAVEALTDMYGPKPLGREDPGPDAVTVLRLSTERLLYR